MKKRIAAVIMILSIAAALSGCAAMEDETVNAIAMEAISSVLSVVAQLAVAGPSVGLTWCVTRIAKTEKFKSISEVLTQLSTTVEDTVGELQQTVVDGLKAAASDGKLTPEEVSALNAKLLELVKAKMAQPAIDLLSAAQIDINALIIGMAESAIKNMKCSAVPVGELIVSEYIQEKGGYGLLFSCEKIEKTLDNALILAYNKDTIKEGEKNNDNQRRNKELD